MRARHGAQPECGIAGGKRGKKRGSKALSEHGPGEEAAAAEAAAEPERTRRRR